MPHYDLRHLVQPGLTGWAQVRFRYGSGIAERAGGSPLTFITFGIVTWRLMPQFGCVLSRQWPRSPLAQIRKVWRSYCGLSVGCKVSEKKGDAGESESAD